ncbi:MAG: glycosyltransferase family 2 protein [Bacteroidia bacterium]
MDLSVIIVNYNVKHFLEQCLLSVRKALRGLEGEIIVVDNNSVDGSQQMVKERFGEDVILIENRDNPGFSKANNQGIHIARGKYILLLNPDTVVEETTFRKCFDFAETHPDCGALGVKMIDGQGRFLPEYQRALPTAWVSFYKIFGLAALFPRNPKFGKYHLSYLDKNQNHEIEVLSGAFMWLRKSVLDKIGLLDETFFMYGEDIDLSYRVILGGYKCWYFAETQIIHYKGESTKKGSLNYVKVFYQAMIIFARKHFGGSKKRLFIGAIMLAVYFRAIVAVLSRFVSRLGIPVMEGALVYGMMYGIKAYWEHYVKYIEGGQYPPEFVTIYMPAYTLIFILFYWMAGAYKKPYRLRPLILAPFFAFVAIATGTYMFGWVKNFSRAIVGLSAIFSMIIAIAVRGAINRREKGSFFFTEETRKRVVVAGEGSGISRVITLIRGELEYPVDIIGVTGSKNLPPELSDVEKLGGIDQLREVIQFYDISEVIFCNQTIPTEKFWI